MNIKLRKETIIRSLRRRGTATVSELANEVSASKRTILRDLNALRDEGYVIHAEPGRGGGLQLDPRSVQTTVKLSVSEVFALLITVTSMYAVGNMPFTGLADEALAKIEKALPQDKLHDLRQLLKSVFVGQLADEVSTAHLGEMDSELLPCFEVAFLQQQQLAFEYCDSKNVVTKRKVEPQAMLILPPIWYLVAWDSHKNDFRHFRMDRIRSPEIVNGLPFLRRHVPFERHVSPLRNLAR